MARGPSPLVQYAMTDTPFRADILIAGAGPTGLVLAIWLTKLGVRVRIIDKVAEPGTTSRALAVQARTLEFYEQIGLAEAVLERGHKVPALNLWVRHARAARVPLEDMGKGLTAFPYPVIFPQDEHERLLIAHLAELGVGVERSLELIGFEDNGQRVLAALRNSDGLRRAQPLCHGPVRPNCGHSLAGSADIPGALDAPVRLSHSVSDRSELPAQRVECRQSQQGTRRRPLAVATGDDANRPAT